MKHIFCVGKLPIVSIETNVIKKTITCMCFIINWLEVVRYGRIGLVITVFFFLRLVILPRIEGLTVLFGVEIRPAVD